MARSATRLSGAKRNTTSSSASASAQAPSSTSARRERHARREIFRVSREAGAAIAHRLVIAAETAVFFSQLRKSNRRRILLDPASKFCDARALRRHSESLYQLSAYSYRLHKELSSPISLISVCPPTDRRKR